MVYVDGNQVITWSHCGRLLGCLHISSWRRYRISAQLAAQQEPAYERYGSGVYLCVSLCVCVCVCVCVLAWICVSMYECACVIERVGCIILHCDLAAC